VDMQSAFKGKCIVLGVTGGIAAYKACEIVSGLHKAGAVVYVVMTANATRFVAPLTFETLSGNPCITDTFERPATWEVEHIALAKRADLFLIAPATANFIAKLSHGIADDMLLTTCLAATAPFLLAPAMNTGMWNAQANQDNLHILERRGVNFIGPDAGMLACGDTGMGRMSEPNDIIAACAALVAPAQDMAGLKVLVTAGPTREDIDPVRYISNRSSGKMGFALALAAQKRGADVTLVAGPVPIAPPALTRYLQVTSTEDLAQAVLSQCASQDIIIQAAAPADYRAENPAKQKIKKAGDEPLMLTLVPTMDVAQAVGRQKRAGQTLVGFAAETEHVTQNAAAKMERKKLDMIIANEVGKDGTGFEADNNKVTVITKESAEDLPLQAKTVLADEILNRIMHLRGIRQGGE
jgi:phosphopantothenoylcysteine decarboxylase / phosphopantothenate---cysteine ligase